MKDLKNKPVKRQRAIKYVLKHKGFKFCGTATSGEVETLHAKVEYAKTISQNQDMLSAFLGAPRLSSMEQDVVNSVIETPHGTVVVQVNEYGTVVCSVLTDSGEKAEQALKHWLDTKEELPF